MSSFRELFGTEPDVSPEGAGQASLIGEHTDCWGRRFLLGSLPVVTRCP